MCSQYFPLFHSQLLCLYCWNLHQFITASVCCHVLEKRGNFGKRQIFQNQICSVLIAGWPARSGRSAGFAANWTTAPSRIRLSSHGNGILQNERGTALVFFMMFFLQFLAINVNVHGVFFVLGLVFNFEPCCHHTSNCQ